MPLFLAALAAVLLGPLVLPAAAAPPENEKLVYEMMFGGLHVADALVSLEETDGHYQATITVRSRGLVSMMSNFAATVDAEGEVDDGVKPAALPVAPALYRREWSAGTTAASLRMTFDPQSHIAETDERIFNPLNGQQLERKDVPWKHYVHPAKPVPANLRKDVIDPVTAFIAARDVVRRHAGAATLTFPIFDGARRYNISAQIDAPRDETVKGLTRRVIAFTAHMKPVAGFDEDLVDDVDRGEGRMLFSADARALPLQVMIGNNYGTGVMNLVADCRLDHTACDAFGAEEAKAN